jgi:ubiquinone/menaquinone biosynthesis C-methylase UbiE
MIFITQTHKIKLNRAHGISNIYFNLGKLSIVWGNKKKFDKTRKVIESKTIEEILSSTKHIGKESGISPDLKFQHDFRKNNTLRAYLTKDAANFSVNFGLTKHRTRIVKYLIESIGGENLKFLELGSGSSVGTACAIKCKNISKAIALDYDEFSLTNIVPIIFKNLNVDDSGVSTKVGTFSETGQSDSSVDVMYAGGALHHCTDYEEAFKEAFRVLKSGGFFFISDFVPHDYLSKAGRDFIFESPHGQSEFCKKIQGKPFLSNKDVAEHQRSDIELLYFAQMAGFQVKCYKFAKPSNNIFILIKNLWLVLFKQRLFFKITDFSFSTCGHDYAGNHRESGYNPILSPAIFNFTAIVPEFLYRRMGVMAPRFDNRLYILRKPKTNENVNFLNKIGKTLNIIPV